MYDVLHGSKIIMSLHKLNILHAMPFTLHKVAYWLHEYNDLYKEIIAYSESLCDECRELEKQDLPFNCLQQSENCTRKYNYFTDFYGKVDYGVKIQELDVYCKTAIEEYYTISGDLQLKNWLIKNFDVGYNRLDIFYMNI